ncbi:hypothetical protein KFL_007760030 [Klebsormidium nitens]|uniref:Uncharacterized protein n=1 Tax=Klebsormidium nitens TaxID=105231 RepID=A0A1Y1IKS1_KLENI|nr:hypothetical protein KFL_007760030 [Klebsormidium nitens]|eukprot:GAQ91384.1 hypothetical protein KFL_007760030 [Klebsormidium nitens]
MQVNKERAPNEKKLKWERSIALPQNGKSKRVAQQARAERNGTSAERGRKGTVNGNGTQGREGKAEALYDEARLLAIGGWDHEDQEQGQQGGEEKGQEQGMGCGSKGGSIGSGRLERG